MSSIGTTHQPCEGSQFQCQDGQCIPSGWECDGEQDCDNGEDENQPKCCKFIMWYKLMYYKILACSVYVVCVRYK